MQLSGANATNFLSSMTFYLNWDNPKYFLPLTYVPATGIASLTKNLVYSTPLQRPLDGTGGAGSHLDCPCPLKYSRKELIRIWSEYKAF